MLLCALVAGARGGVGHAAEYGGTINGDTDNNFWLRTVERSPGHWYARFDTIDFVLDCGNERKDYAILGRGDVRPAAVPIRRGRFRATLRQVDFELDPFVRSGTVVLAGRFGPTRPSGRVVRGSITVRRVGEGGTVCRGQAAFFASR